MPPQTRRPEDEREQPSREDRIRKYCCVGLFCAIHEWDERNEIELSSGSMGGEFTWAMWASDGRRTFIVHCPFCGTRLPSEG
jgi:hypothetical protein